MAMDASLLLKRQGWLGTGHSLDEHAGNPSKASRGLKRPLLVSKKVDVLGVGLNKHAAVSDQWWLRAYDQGLQTLGSGKESALAQAQKHGVNRGGLYGRFVRGEGVPGTIGVDLVSGKGVTGQKPAEVVHTVQVGEGGLPTPVDSDGDGAVKRKEKGEKKRKREGEEAKKSKKDKKEKKATGIEKEDKVAKKARKEAKKEKKRSTAQEEVLDPEKRALYTKRAAEKGVSLEIYVKRRQEKYAAKKDEKRK